MRTHAISQPPTSCLAWAFSQPNLHNSFLPEWQRKLRAPCLWESIPDTRNCFVLICINFQQLYSFINHAKQGNFIHSLELYIYSNYQRTSDNPQKKHSLALCKALHMCKVCELHMLISYDSTVRFTYFSYTWNNSLKSRCVELVLHVKHYKIQSTWSSTQCNKGI